MKGWEKTCREKTGLGFETFKTIAHCDAETLDALLEAAPGSIKGTMYFDWLMEYLSLAQSGKNADVKTVVDDIDALSKCLSINKKILAVLQTNTARVLYVNTKITQNIQSNRVLLRRS